MFKVIVLAVVAVIVLSACGGTTNDGKPCDGYVTTCAYEIVKGDHGNTQPAVQEPAKRTDLTRDFNGAYCLNDEAVSVQGADGTFSAVCPSTKASCDSIAVTNGFASCEKWIKASK